MKKEYDFSKGKRRAIDPLPAGKTRITIRLDNDVIDWFRGQVESRGGGNYQTMINNVLREYIYEKRQDLEEVVRCVLREELTKLGMTGIQGWFQTVGNDTVRNDIKNKEMDGFAVTPPHGNQIVIQPS